MSEFWEKTYMNNTFQDYAIVLGSILLGLIIVKIFKRTLLKKLQYWAAQTSTDIDDYIIDTVTMFGMPALYATVVYTSLKYLNLSVRLDNVITIAMTVVITYMVIRFVSATILRLFRVYIRKQENGEEKVKQLGGLMIIINVMVWIVGLLFFFDNMGYDVTAVVAGLGVGGIAIALAAQNILGDLFNYFVIFFDRPFEVGDFLIVDDKLGTVEYIGVKTTRLKSLSGEQLVFANSDLTKSRIHNYKRMERRRVVFKIGVVYQTSYQLLKQIPELLKSTIQEQPDVEFDRAHFQKYGDSSLDFEVVYYVLSADYNVYMDRQQAINYRIFEEFEKKGVSIAYPTRTLFLHNEGQDGNDVSPATTI
ncbi:mechanosensitive ion channel [Fulvivirga sp. 29W222]|uniref:Mechanosensitive ion channel n=1 Tax=Fulvivirga marina TaxID=2494733 RepID=A0A937FTW3_9BACT|nr:mechanosensitive ion channel domain-containing protein [Fulvivirga marina]MBL6444727.1 mechanosensitive ion channel [Fulvivirga marina]